MRQRDVAESAVVEAGLRRTVHVKAAKKPFPVEFVRGSRIGSGPRQPGSAASAWAGVEPQYGQASECRAAEKPVRRMARRGGAALAAG